MQNAEQNVLVCMLGRNRRAQACCSYLVVQFRAKASKIGFGKRTVSQGVCKDGQIAVKRQGLAQGELTREVCEELCRLCAGIMYRDGEGPPQKGEDGDEVPRWWELLREAAADTPACHQELGEILNRSFHFLHDFGRCLAWLLIYLELLLMSLISFFTLAITPLIHNHSAKGAAVLRCCPGSTGVFTKGRWFSSEELDISSRWY